MDLLEYMRSQDTITQAEWERTFEDEAREILVLLAGGGGAGKRSGFWDVSHYFIAYVDARPAHYTRVTAGSSIPSATRNMMPEESLIASDGRRCTASRRARRFRTRFPRA